jgi:hypothetical protein
MEIFHSLLVAALLTGLPIGYAQDIDPSPVTTFGTTVVVSSGLRGEIYF